MLTLEINDARLEQKILEKARAIGKSVQELVRDIVAEKMQADETPETLPFDIPKLDYRQYVRIYEPDIETTDDDSTVQPFSHVTDTVEYARQLRKDAWNRK
jgi:hypothetical protein